MSASPAVVKAVREARIAHAAFTESPHANGIRCECGEDFTGNGKLDQWAEHSIVAVAAAAEAAALEAPVDLLRRVESILSLLHHRGLVDSERNRADVAEALRIVEDWLRERAGEVRS